MGLGAEMAREENSPLLRGHPRPLQTRGLEIGQPSPTVSTALRSGWGWRGRSRDLEPDPPPPAGRHTPGRPRSPGTDPGAPPVPRLPRSTAPTASAVRSRVPPQVRPASRLVTQQRRAAFLPVAICATSGVWPRTATKNRKTVPVRESCTGQGFIERCPSRAAVPSTRAAPHCREGEGPWREGSLSVPSSRGRPTPPPRPGHSPAPSPPPACRASAPGGGRARRWG